MRRRCVLKPQRPQPLQRCDMCWCRRRLGRWWCPPRALLEAGAATADALLAGAAALEIGVEGFDDSEGQYLWYCEPCWSQWLVRYKQWYVEEGWGPETLPNKAKDGITSDAAGPGTPPNKGKEEVGSDESETTAGSDPSSSSVSPPSSTASSSSPPRDDDSSGGFRESPTRDVDMGGSSDTNATDGVDGADDTHHFDFIEIGTSNYHTFTQSIASHPDGKPFAWAYLRWCDDPTSMRGLAVDMKRRYLDQLPDLPNVEKVQAAVSEVDGCKRMYHVPVRDIERWEGIFAARGSRRGYRAVRLARGCSALGRHRVLRRALGQLGLQHLIRAKRVRTSGVNTLLRKHKVKSIDVLALDCEGHDCAILRGLMNACDVRPAWYPQWILFETNGMNDELFGQGTEKKTVRALKKRGYKVWYGGGYWETWKRDTVLKRCW